MRVHELAKALGLSSKELLVRLKALRISAKVSTSTLDADAVNRARKALVSRAPAKKPAAAGRPAATAPPSPVGRAVPERPGIGQAAKSATPARPIAAAKKAAVSSERPAGESAEAVPPARREAAKPSVAAQEATRSAPSARRSPGRAGTKAAGSSQAAKGSPQAAAPSAAADVEAPSGPSMSAASGRLPGASPGPSGVAVQPPAPTGSIGSPPTRSQAASAGVEVMEAPLEAATAEQSIRRLELSFPITVKDLATKMDLKANEVIKYLMQQGVFASIVQPLDEATVTKVARAFQREVVPQPTLEDQLLRACQPDPEKAGPRAPVVTFMGHVDHGKTSLLDAIRQAKVAEKEAGGITQHIGAYEVLLEKGHVTFLDTPGHEAFSALRARGANVTDIVVLVVAADDGVMPQTIEAIDHAKAAGAPIVVAVNKMDKPEANLERIRQQLSQHGLLAEDWGGKTIMVPVSARTRQGIDGLLEMLLLEAELLELKADSTTLAQGAVIEGKQTKDRGPVATLLVQQGTLRVGETILVGHLMGRVRAMSDDRGHRIKEAGPSKPVEILGLPEVPRAGDRFLVVADERAARQLAAQRQEAHDQRAVLHPKRVTLQELHQRIMTGQLKELRLIIKADVQGSAEAIVQSLQKLDVEKHGVQLRILHVGVGDINESDVILAAASDAVVAGFHVGMEPTVQVLAAREGVDVHIYQIIYELVDAIKAAIEGLLEPEIEETFVGRAEIRKLFQVSKYGLVAGCFVTKGAIRRDCVIRVVRGRERVVETKIAGLRRVKDDVREVQEALECGISLEGNVDLQVGDLLEAWELKKVARKLA